MTDRYAMLRAIAANPDDDTPRLIYADLLDELGGAVNTARARFIRLQIETYRAPGDTGGTLAFERKRAEATDLANRHHRDWLHELPTWCNPLFGLLGRAPADLFSRGFVERVSSRAKVFSLHAAELFDCAPIRALELQGGSAHLVPAVFACPPLARLRALTVQWRNVSAELAAALTTGPELSNLIELDLADCWLDERGARILSRSDRFPVLRVLRLGGPPLCAGVVRTLAGSPKLAHLTTIDLLGGAVRPHDLETLRNEFPAKTFRA
jgi:uncharacterized protein (TIGR02996 family)